MSFNKFSQESALPHPNIWGLMIDSKDLLLISTNMDVAPYDGTAVTPFVLPESMKDPDRAVSHPKLVSGTFEDSKGNIWINTPGGSYKNDGTTLQHFSEKGGLAGSSVNHKLEDTNGDFWFATFYNGLSRYDGDTFTNFTQEGTITGNEIWNLFKDSDGNIWFPGENHGVYHYNDKTFTNFGKAQGLENNPIQCIFQDKDGLIWFGGYLVLFRVDGEKVVSVTKYGLEVNNKDWVAGPSIHFLVFAFDKF